MILKPHPANVRGGFAGTKGVGKVELKFCGGGDQAKVQVRVLLGPLVEDKKPSSEFREHDFSLQPLCVLPEELNFTSSAKDRDKVLLHVEACKVS